MRQLITLAILAALGVAGWMYWPQIKALLPLGEQTAAERKTEPDQPLPPPPVGRTQPSGAVPSGEVPSGTPGAGSPETASTGTPADVPKQADDSSQGQPGAITSLPGPSGKATPINVELELRLVPTETGDLSLVGATNLEPGTYLELAVTPIGNTAKGKAAKGKAAKERPIVQVAAVRPATPTNIFTWDKLSVPDGEYRVELHMGPGRFGNWNQLAAIYGQRGEMLRGRFVHKVNNFSHVRAHGTLRTSPKPTEPVTITLTGGPAR